MRSGFKAQYPNPQCEIGRTHCKCLAPKWLVNLDAKRLALSRGAARFANALNSNTELVPVGRHGSML